MESALVMVVKSIVIFAFILQIVPLILLLERKLLGRFQSRIGPNRVGPKGLMQPIADVFKLLSKEASAPATAVPWMMAIAPVISILTAVATLAIMPFGPYDAWGGELRALRHRRVDRAALLLRLRLARRSTGSCSAAGPPAPSTRSSAPCAPPPS